MNNVPKMYVCLCNACYVHLTKSAYVDCASKEEERVASICTSSAGMNCAIGCT